MKKILSALLVTVMVCTLVAGTTSNVARAEEEPEIVDGSYLTDEDSSEVVVGPKTRGIYLKSGSSSITELGSGKIGAGGSTTAQTTVSSISVHVRVQRLLNGSWASYTSWSVVKSNTSFVSTSKTLTVPKGYYYRTYCSHAAESDGSGSYTSGIYID